MKCVVTGGAGFIGSHLCERLLKDGHKVWAIDDESVGRRSNLDEAFTYKNFAYFKMDITRSASFDNYFEGADWVFHLGAKADIVPSISKPYDYHKTNVTGTLRILQACRKYDVRRFIYAASSSCYGIPDKVPTDEKSEIRCMYPYALTKYLGECYALHWAKVYGLPTVSLRFFNVYGPRARTSGTYGAVFGVFLAQIHHGKPLTVVGDGRQTRDFTFVTDAVDALVTAAQSNLSSEILNVGSGNTHSVNQLVELLDPTAGVIYLPKRPGEPDCTFADISKIQRLLGWSPKISFEQGVNVMKDLIHTYKDAPLWEKDSIAEATRDWFECLR